MVALPFAPLPVDLALCIMGSGLVELTDKPCIFWATHFCGAQL